jgi:hypothetical protein
MNAIQQQFRGSNQPSLTEWLEEATAAIGMRTSPRQPLQTKLAKYIQRFYSQKGIYVDDDDASICALLLMMKHTNYQ